MKTEPKRIIRLKYPLNKDRSKFEIVDMVEHTHFEGIIHKNGAYYFKLSECGKEAKTVYDTIAKLIYFKDGDIYYPRGEAYFDDGSVCECQLLQAVLGLLDSTSLGVLIDDDIELERFELMDFDE